MSGPAVVFSEASVSVGGSFNVQIVKVVHRDGGHSDYRHDNDEGGSEGRGDLLCHRSSACPCHRLAKASLDSRQSSWLPLPTSRSRSRKDSLTSISESEISVESIQEDSKTMNLLRQTFYVLKLVQEILHQLRRLSNPYAARYMGHRPPLKKMVSVSIPLIFRIFGSSGSNAGFEYLSIRNQVLKEIGRMKELLGTILQDLKEGRNNGSGEVTPDLVLREVLYMVWDCFWSFISEKDDFTRSQEEMLKCRTTIDAALTEMIAIDAGCHDPQRRICVHRIQICDFFGMKWSLPKDLCSRRKVFLQILLFQFEGGPAEQVVALETFNVFRRNGSKPISRANWARVIEADDSLQLSVVIGSRPQSQSPSTLNRMACPRCPESQSVVPTGNGWALCVACGSSFNIARSRSMSSIAATVTSRLIDGLMFKTYSVLQAHTSSSTNEEQVTSTTSHYAKSGGGADSGREPVSEIPFPQREDPLSTSTPPINPEDDLLNAKSTQDRPQTPRDVEAVHATANDSKATASKEDNPQAGPSVKRESFFLKDPKGEMTSTDVDQSTPESSPEGFPPHSPPQQKLEEISFSSMRQSFEIVLGWQTAEFPASARALIGSSDLWKLASRIGEQPTNFMIIVHQSLMVAKNAKWSCRQGSRTATALLGKLEKEDPNLDDAYQWYPTNALDSALRDTMSTLKNDTNGVHNRFRLLRTVWLDIRKDLNKANSEGERSHFLARLSRHLSRDVRMCEALLRRIHDDLRDVGSSLDLITRWWQKIQSEVKHLQMNNASRLLMPEANKILLQEIKETFASLEARLADYMTHMSQFYNEHIDHLNSDSRSYLEKISGCTNLVVSERGRFQPQ